MATRTLIRHRDVRLLLPNTVDTPRNEEGFLSGRYFEAGCLATDAVADFVYVTGDPIGGLIQCTKVDPLSAASMPAVGIIVDKPTVASCFVQTVGEIAAAGLMSGRRYFVGTDAQIFGPSHPVPGVGEILAVQSIGIALTQTRFLLRPDLITFKLRG